MSVGAEKVWRAAAAELEERREWAAVKRVTASPRFQRSQRLRDLLYYICERALTGRADEITEPLIGMHVFGRPAGYNYSEDNIVRSNARLLRLKLEGYFAAEGRGESIVITVPKGGYVPVFSPRDRVAEVPAPADSHPLWSRVFNDHRSTTIVVSDHAFKMVQDVAGRRFSLSEYLGSDYRSGKLTDPRLEELLPGFVERHHTLLYDVTVVGALMALPYSSPERVSIRYSRDVTMYDVAGGNAVLLGGNDVNPWRELYEPRLNFYQVRDHVERRNYFINRVPKPGELPRYEERDGLIQYGGLAFLPNLNHSGEVLLIFGTEKAGVEAVVGFLTDRDVSDRFYAELRRGAGTEQLPYFEVLLETVTVKNDATEAPTRTSMVGYRVISSADPTIV